MYWRDQAAQLDPFDSDGFPDQSLEKSCGTLGSRPSVGPKSIAQSAGIDPTLDPNMVFIHVYPKTPGQSMSGVNYTLRYQP